MKYNISVVRKTGQVVIYDDDAKRELKFTPFITESEIREDVKKVANDVSKFHQNLVQEKLIPDLQGKNILLVNVLNGATLFHAKLLQELSQLGLECEMDSIKISSYKADESGELEVERRLNVSKKVLQEMLVIFVEDIIHSGQSARFIINAHKNLQTKGLALVTHLYRKDCAELDPVTKEHLISIGRQIQNYFVLGHFFDYKQVCRGLRDIYKMESETKIT